MNSLVELPPLTQQDDTFCLAMIEYGGNLGAAFVAAYGEEIPLPAAKAREMLCRPEIAKRINELAIITEEASLISVGSHLNQLAEIRDLAKVNKQLKTALDAEKTRGEVVGIYSRHLSGKDAGPKGPTIQINIGSSPQNISAWADVHGKPPVIVAG